MFSFPFARRRTSTGPHSALCRHPRLEVLDDRITPTVSSITGQFNGTSVPAGSTLWFNSAFKVSGMPSHAVTLHVEHASVSSSAFQVAVPDAVITLSPDATAATTTFDAARNTWLTTVPTNSGGLIGGLISGLLGGNSFLDGAALTLPNGLAGGVQNVTFTADFTSDTPGVTVNWQWGCAVYRSFSADYSALGIKPVDASTGNQYHNLDRAGTPESFKSFVAPGATGNGGMNYTGSYSNAGRPVTSQWVPPPPSNGTASISGTVFQDINFNGVQDPDEVGMEGVELDLTGVDANGMSVSLVTHTDANGHYSFTGLMAGTYRLFEVQPEHFLDGGDSVGSVNGESRGTRDGQDMIGEIVLHDGDQAMGYNFAEIFDSND
jgi:hypothetical protein